MSENADSGIRHHNGVMIIEPPSELLDRLEISNVGDAWLQAIQAERPQRVVINFDGVSFFGSEAIGLILRIAKRVREYGGEVKLCSMGENGAGDFRNLPSRTNFIPGLRLHR